MHFLKKTACQIKKRRVWKTMKALNLLRITIIHIIWYTSLPCIYFPHNYAILMLMTTKKSSLIFQISLLQTLTKKNSLSRFFQSKMRRQEERKLHNVSGSLTSRDVPRPIRGKIKYLKFKFLAYLVRRKVYSLNWVRYQSNLSRDKVKVQEQNLQT